jgi:hypothetical protein
MVAALRSALLSGTKTPEFLEQHMYGQLRPWCNSGGGCTTGCTAGASEPRPRSPPPETGIQRRRGRRGRRPVITGQACRMVPPANATEPRRPSRRARRGVRAGPRRAPGHILVRADSASASHQVLGWLQARNTPPTSTPRRGPTSTSQHSHRGWTTKRGPVKNKPPSTLIISNLLLDTTCVFSPRDP